MTLESFFRRFQAKILYKRQSKVAIIVIADRGVIVRGVARI